MQYIVETRVGNTWENTWTEDDVPCVFDSEHEARAALRDLMHEMPDYDAADYRVMLDLSRYDAVEVAPLRREIIDGVDCFEMCEATDSDLHCWGVYLHDAIDGGVVSVADCPTQDTANLIAAGLEKMLTQAMHPVI
jgi:hypothetical protein